MSEISIRKAQRSEDIKSPGGQVFFGFVVVVNLESGIRACK